MVDLKTPEFLIFLGRNNIYFFEPRAGFAKEVSIPSGVVKDLEVVDPNALSTLIGSFLDNEKITPGKVVIVASEAISFTKDIPFSEENKKGVLVQDFTDTIPLESPEVKVFRTSDLYKVVGINSKYSQVMIETLVAKGFWVVGLIPGSVIPEIGPTETITIETAGKVLLGFDKIRLQNFIEGPPSKNEGRPQAIITTGNPKGNTIYILVGVFVIGIIALLALIFLRK